jgi:hypothetical protein
MRGFPDGNREEGRGIVSDGAGERESIFRATHEEVFVAGVAQASRLGAAGDREGHSRAEHKRVHRVARHFTVVATLRVTSTIREQRPTVVQKSKFWRHCDLSRDQKSTNANARFSVTELSVCFICIKKRQKRNVDRTRASPARNQLQRFSPKSLAGRRVVSYSRSNHRRASSYAKNDTADAGTALRSFRSNPR